MLPHITETVLSRIVTAGLLSAALLTAPRVAAGQTYHFSTFIGLPVTGTADGPVASARLGEPHSIVVSGTTIYLTDRVNHTVRKIDAGAVTTMAGLAGTSGNVDGTGTAARFRSPGGIAIGSDNVLYVADTANHLIRKITLAGVVTTFAGSGTAGSADGTGTGAQFSSPIGIAVDASLNVYVSDSGNHTIRQITPGGVVTTLAGTAGAPGTTDGTGAAARFSTPFGLVLDGTGSLFVTATGSHTIRQVVIATAAVTTVAGTAGVPGSTDGTGTAATFNLPRGITRDQSGTFYVADGGAHIIRKIAPGWVVTKLSGQGGGASGYQNGPPNTTLFNLPVGVAPGPSGSVYVADANNAAIRVVASSGDSSTLVGINTAGDGPGTGSNARTQLPVGVTVNRTTGHVYSVSFIAHTVKQITARGVATNLAGTSYQPGAIDDVGAAARFNSPNKIAVDSAGNLYVADRLNHTIRKVTPAGVVTTLAGLAGSSGSADGTGSAARFLNPGSVAIAPDDTLYVTDANHVVRQVSLAGVVTTIAGLAGSSGSADGTGTGARFSTPGGMAVDATHVYVADGFNHTVRRVTRAGGVVTTIAGAAGVPGSVDGTGNAARFNFILDLAMDSAGDLYGVEFGSHIVRKITPAGVVTTIAGLAGERGSTDGSGPTARFNQPTGIAIGKHDVIYIADRTNNTIRMGVKATTEVVTNGSFATGDTTGWLLFGLPTSAAIVSNVTGGVFQYYRNGTQAVVIQETGLPLPAAAPIQAQFEIGNSDSVRKRISVLLHDNDFGDLAVCTFFLAPNAALATYTMRTHTTKAWGNVTASFYAATNGTTSGGFYRLDNVSIQYAPALSATETLCGDPTTPTAPGGSPSGNLLVNGDFGSGTVAPGWGLTGQIQGQVTAGVFEFIKLAGTPAGVLLQLLSQPMSANQIITATFQLGNSSSVRKRVTVILHDISFSDLSACTFWLAPNSPLASYTMRMFASQAWATPTFSVYPATTGADQWIRFDNATFQQTPGSAITGTECLEPGSSFDLPRDGRRPLAVAVRVLTDPSEPADAAEQAPSSEDWSTEGFEIVADGSWEAVARTTSQQTLTLAASEVAPGEVLRLTFDSDLRTVASRARVEIGVDDEQWTSVLAVEASEQPVPVQVDLSGLPAGPLRIRFVFEGVAPEGGTAPDVWRVGGLSLTRVRP